MEPRPVLPQAGPSIGPDGKFSYLDEEGVRHVVERLLGGAPAGGPASEHCHQADMASLELAGHRLGGAQRHQAGLLDRPAPATEVQGKAGR